MMILGWVQVVSFSPKNTSLTTVFLEGSELDPLVNDEFENVLARQPFFDFCIRRTRWVMNGVISHPAGISTRLDNQSELIIFLLL